MGDISILKEDDQKPRIKKASKKSTSSKEKASKKKTAMNMVVSKMQKFIFFTENDKYGKRANSPKFFINIRNLHSDGKIVVRRIGSESNKVDLKKTMKALSEKFNASITSEAQPS